MSSSPGTVRCDSQNRRSPSHGKWGLARSSPPPSADRSAPTAQPFDAIWSVGTRPAVGAAAAVSFAADGAGVTAGAGGWALAMKLATTPLLALSATERAYAYSSTGSIGRTHGAPAHHPARPSTPTSSKCAFQ